MTGAGVFDALAPTYDETFSQTTIGSLFRRAVRRRLDALFRPGDRVLELNCGTGEDAVHLAARGVRVLATDLSPAMLETTASKAAAAGLASEVSTLQLDLVALARPETPPGLDRVGLPFDGALSNFGGLNCVADLEGVARGLARVLRPGARVLLCLMGCLVPWEWAWYLGQGQPRKAFRRLRRGGADWRGLRIRYPTIGTVRRAFRPAFRARRVSAVGVLVPPPYVESWASRHPRLLAWLERMERRVEAVPPLPWLADHYVLELVRR